MTKHVAVLYGGWSSEREVSLVSGRNCAKTLEESGYEVTLIDVEHDLTALIAALDPAPDVVFNALHGRHGEDGKIQALLDILEIPYTHSGALASALAMDKPMAKRLFAAAAIPCPDGRIVRREELANGPVIDPPYVIKPPNEGSSVGVRIVLEGDNRPPLDDWPFGDLVLVESYIPGRELTVGVMGDRALGVTELRTHEGFYDYAAKYEEGRATHLCPAPIPDEIADLAMEYALKAHETLGCRGVSRADLRYDDTGGQPGDLYMLEINTQPGMTPLSLVPEVAAHAGIDFPQLVSWIVEDASCPR
ncbi:MAG: D-alanine--D-alanine ligase [Proteobacteria bacterium]|nr:D-alanine--D-alanine ligase [Pseudomonadota bacterium]